MYALPVPVLSLTPYEYPFAERDSSGALLFSVARIMLNSFIFSFIISEISFGSCQLFDVISAGNVFPGSRRSADGIGGDRLQHVFVGAGVRRGLVYAIDCACKGVAAVAAGKGGVGGAFLNRESGSLRAVAIFKGLLDHVVKTLMEVLTVLMVYPIVLPCYRRNTSESKAIDQRFCPALVCLLIGSGSIRCIYAKNRIGTQKTVQRCKGGFSSGRGR